MNTIKHKRRPGKKVGDGTEAMTRMTVTIGQKTITLLRVLGNGNISEGIRVAARVAYDKYQDEPEQA